MAVHNSTGQQGEALAALWLEANGYTILHRNWRYKNWELDIIASKHTTLHIVEIKTRTSAYLGHPEENITDKKMQYLINAAEEYMYQHPQWQLLQFDVLAITLRRDGEHEYFLVEDIYL
ncbi:MAG: YraN family protein [Ferruginibacter sp.]